MNNCKGESGCQCEYGGYIKHFSHLNANNDKLCYTTMTDEMLLEWARNQTEAQQRMNEWLTGLE